MAKGSKLRSQEEIQRAHDLLEGLLQMRLDAQAGGPIDEETRAANHTMGLVARTLCWVLQHPGGVWAQELLDGLEQLANTAGFELVRAPDDDNYKLN